MRYKFLLALKFLSVFNLSSSVGNLAINDCFSAEIYSFDLFKFCKGNNKLQPCRLSPNELFDEDIKKCVCQLDHVWDKSINECVYKNFRSQTGSHNFVTIHSNTRPDIQAQNLFRQYENHIVPPIRLVNINVNGEEQAYLVNNLATEFISNEEQDKMNELYRKLKPLYEECYANLWRYTDDVECQSIKQKWKDIRDWVALFDSQSSFSFVTDDELFKKYLELKEILLGCASSVELDDDKCIKADELMSKFTMEQVQKFRERELSDQRFFDA